jgi:Cu(I)/Ag(I) efflux system membrane protein CusA/SilA
MIHVIFEDGTAVETARQHVAQRLATSRGVLPEGVTPYLAPESPATGQVFWYTVEGTNHDLRELREIQDWFIGPQLAGLPGVAEVASVGGHTSEYTIEVDPARLRLFGISLDQIVQAVAAARPAGLETLPARRSVTQLSWMPLGHSQHP